MIKETEEYRPYLNGNFTEVVVMNPTLYTKIKELGSISKLPFAYKTMLKSMNYNFDKMIYYKQDEYLHVFNKVISKKLKKELHDGVVIKMLINSEVIEEVTNSKLEVVFDPIIINCPILIISNDLIGNTCKKGSENNDNVGKDDVIGIGDGYKESFCKIDDAISKVLIDKIGLEEVYKLALH